MRRRALGCPGNFTRAPMADSRSTVAWPRCLRCSIVPLRDKQLEIAWNAFLEAQSPPTSAVSAKHFGGWSLPQFLSERCSRTLPTGSKRMRLARNTVSTIDGDTRCAS